MGCFLSRRTFVVNENIEGQDNVVLELCSELGLTTSDINILYTAFWDIDADGSGAIAQAELFAYFEVESTPFERNIFGLFDEGNNNHYPHNHYPHIIVTFLLMVQ
jgi:Ca2+-binding EF-hand superfamily protein